MAWDMNTWITGLGKFGLTRPVVDDLRLRNV